MPEPTDVTKMTYQQILDAARTLFPNCTVEGEEGQWFVSTGVEVVDDMSPFVGTPAYDAYQEYESSYGSALERWMNKNGDGGSSLHQAAVQFNEEIWMRREIDKRIYESLSESGHQRLTNAINSGDWDKITAADFRTYDSAQANAMREVREELAEKKNVR